jgi:hypothetical protein
MEFPKEEWNNLVALSNELYAKTLEAIARRDECVVVIIRFPLSVAARVYLEQHGLTIRLVPEKYHRGGITFEMWKEAIVMT